MFDQFDLSIRHTDASLNPHIEDDVEAQFQIDIHDENGEWFAQTVGPDFPDVLKHALYIANPTLACASFDDYFDWVDGHIDNLDKRLR